jgi:hypothetical protein
MVQRDAAGGLTTTNHTCVLQQQVCACIRRNRHTTTTQRLQQSCPTHSVAEAVPMVITSATRHTHTAVATDLRGLSSRCVYAYRETETQTTTPRDRNTAVATDLCGVSSRRAHHGRHHGCQHSPLLPATCTGQVATSSPSGASTCVTTPSHHTGPPECKHVGCMSPTPSLQDRLICVP